MKYTALLDYVLEILKMERAVYPNTYVSIVSILKYFNHKAAFGEIQEIGRYTENRGWTKVVYLLGDVRAQITTSGLLHLEQKEDEQYKNDFSDFFDEIRKGKDQNEFLYEVFDEQNHRDPKKDIVELLETVDKKIKDKRGDVDLSKDVQVIKLELTKLKPDFRLLEPKLDNLGSLIFISPEVQELKDYLNIMG